MECGETNERKGDVKQKIEEEIKNEGARKLKRTRNEHEIVEEKNNDK
jgi:hypothetical protein